MASEREQLLASALANFRFPEGDSVKINGVDTNIRDLTLKELLYNKEFLAANSGRVSKDTLQFLRNNMTDGNNICGDWKILSESDEDDAGFYGVCVDIGNNQAMMSFEGTDFSKPADWAADAGLLTTVQTAQQKKCERYVKEFMNDPKYKDYKVGFSGHSLGGSLAFHAGLVAAMINVNRITCVTNFDGPGNSEEYLKKHKEAFKKLEKANVEVKLFQWSIVGAILSVDGSVDFITVDMPSPPSDSDILNVGARHCGLYNEAILDENGLKRGGEMGPLPRFVNYVTKYFDFRVTTNDPSLTDYLLSILSLSDKERVYYDLFLVAYNLFKEMPLEMLAIVFIITNLVKDYIVMKLLIWGYTVGQRTSEMIIEFVISAYKKTLIILGKGLETLELFAKEVSIVVYNIIGEISKMLNYGYRYALNNSRLMVDTNLLRNYATQVQRIMNRIDEIESRLTRIYRTTISTDFFPWTSYDRSLIYNVGLVSGVDDYKTRFRKIKSYLSQTAQEFEETEKKLSKSLEVSYK